MQVSFAFNSTWLTSTQNVQQRLEWYLIARCTICAACKRQRFSSTRRRAIPPRIHLCSPNAALCLYRTTASMASVARRSCVKCKLILRQRIQGWRPNHVETAAYKLFAILFSKPTSCGISFVLTCWSLKRCRSHASTIAKVRRTERWTRTTASR